jgi:hypothetical protein
MTVQPMSYTNSHFSVEEWADFGRGRISPEARSRMEQHLQQGCQSCSETLQVWSGVLEVAARDEAFEPPAGALRCAKALYGVLPPQPAGGLSMAIAQMVRFRQPAMAGVRACGSVTGHVLFKEGSLLLDLHLQTRPASQTVSIVGQLVDSTQLDRRFDNRSVALMREKDLLARTTTDEFGEFQLEFEPREDLLLMVEVENKSYLVSRLPAPEKERE